MYNHLRETYMNIGEHEINGRISMLEAQRTNAENQCVLLAGQNAALAQENAELKARITEMVSDKDVSEVGKGPENIAHRAGE